MNTSWAAISIVLTLITPAIPFLFWLRLSFPRAIANTSSEVTFLVTGGALGGLFNLQVFGQMAQEIFKQFYDIKTLPIVDREFVSFLLKQNFTPLRPAIWIERMCTGQVPSVCDLFTFFWDLHLRTFLFGFLIWGVLFIVSIFENNYQGFVWRRHIRKIEEQAAAQNAAKTAAIASGAEVETLEPSQSTYSSEHAMKRSRFSKFLNYIRQVYFHPWALSTQSFKSRELLMVDVLTKDDGMYSGLFTSFSPEGNGVSNVGLEYVVLYTEPTEEASQEKPSYRKKVFIKNNGELIIPFDNIANLHFWEIRWGFNLKITILHKTGGEVLKQYLVLHHLFPGFIRSIRFWVDMQPAKEKEFLLDLKTWLNDNRMDLKDPSIRMVVADKAT